MTTTVNISFESGTNLATYFDFGDTGGGDLSITTGAALHGANGMQAVINDTAFIHQAKGFTKQSGFRFRYYFDLNGITMVTTNNFRKAYFSQQAGSFLRLFDINLDDLVGQKRFIFKAYNDPFSEVISDICDVTDDVHFIEVKGVRAATSSSNDGSYEWWVDGVSQGSVTGVDNYNLFIDQDWYLYLGTSGLDAGTSGTIFFDDITVTDTPNTEIGPITVLPPRKIKLRQAVNRASTY